jgi:hypothetical protein
LVAFGVVLVLLVVYGTSAPRTLPEADSGEFAAIAVHGGIPHPPGYPLLVVVLQLCARLSALVGVIPALVLPSILAAAGAALLMVHVLIRRGWLPTEAAVATLAGFLSVNVWRDATSFEPFALNLLLAAAVIYCCCQYTQAEPHTRAGAGWLFAIGAAFGLGLCNHHSLLFLAPLPAAVVLTEPKSLPARVPWLLAGFIAGATPLLLFLVLRTQPGWIWGDWDAFLPRLLTHVFRREYGTLTLSPAESHGRLMYGPMRMLATLPAALSYAFFLILLTGVISEIKAVVRTRTVPDGFAIGTVLSFLTTGLVFPMLFRLAGTPLDNLIADRFLALPMLLLTLPLASGVRALREALPRVSMLVLLGLLASQIAFVWPRAARVDHRFYEDHIRNILTITEPGSTLIVVADGGFSSGLYARYVLNRPDIQLVIDGLASPWYVKRMARTFGALTDPAVQRSVGKHGPLYLLDVPRTVRALQPLTYPVGPLLRVVVGGMTLPSAAEVFERNRALFARLRLPSVAELQHLDAWEAEELTNYYRAWEMIGKRLDTEGRRDLAQLAYRYRDAFAPPRR